MAEPTSETNNHSAAEAGKKMPRPTPHNESWIDRVLEDTFPASDPPGWTCGTEPLPGPGSNAQPEQNARQPEVGADAQKAADMVRETARVAERNARADTGQVPHDPTSPGKAFWDHSPDERAKFVEAQAMKDEDIDESGTDLTGRRDIYEGPHEPLPAHERSPGQREHAGSEGEPMIYDHWTRKALYDKACTLGVKGRSRMSKTELIEAIRDSGEARSA